ncbi:MULTISPECIES: polysaccharide ABC transporter ATP-binding protein [unclassified Olleya]|jgi:lipopolysaccharide transport system ATP-binding protein|uniref:ABC transporter ATP-binding protein n=1 Tax=unclassified Olleya TaxID=2615019 RepID=UPI0011A4321C|nr:polysaccharide ABC transporter ATP-binding protein [Olleya sp. Hel_I_94]TVZ49680.1 ABC-type polysaccharide/polyol phosphate transport system ATPase subunit [Olleya sp. Hel_I_94]
MEEKDIILKAEHISKQYRLGLVGTGTISHDLNRWWHKVRGKADPYLKVGESNDRSTKAQSEYVWALQDINFEVKRGEVLGIIGKNGAGKSTLLKILSKVTGPTTGEIKTKGRIASLLEVGTGFHGEMTGRENVYLNGAILGMTKKEISSKIDEIIEFSGCQRYIDTPVKRYSSGMTVRLAFAVAAFLEPEILVIDEVLAVGDAEFQKKAIGKMQDISRGEGRTVLFVSHNMSAIKNLCTRAILVEKGRIRSTGSVDNIINLYLSQMRKEKENFESLERKGNGVIKITSVKTKSIGNDFHGTVGLPFSISFDISNNSNFKVCDVRLDIRIDDSLGQKYAWLSTSVIPYDVKSKNNVVKTISFELEKLNLQKGIYYVTTYLECKGEVSDWIQNAFDFEILDGKYYESDAKVPNNQGKILLDYSIKHS